MVGKNVFEIFIKGHKDDSEVVYGFADSYEELTVIIKSFSKNYDITIRKSKVI